MAFADTQKLVVELDLKGNLQSGLAKATASVKGFDKATSNTQRSLSKFGSNIGKTFAIGAAAAAGGVLAVVHAASDYESAFAGVRKTVDATEEQLQDLSNEFRSLAKTIPISAAELARLGEAGGALGISVENLEEFVRVTALLGVTTDLTSDQAATSLGVLANVLHLTDKEYQQFASSLVALGNAGASTESQIIAIAERAGAAGELVGLTTEQVLGLSSAVASLGIEAEAGGTSLQKFFIDSAKQIANGGEELELFAKVAGTSGKAFKKAFDKDAGGALQRFLAGLGKLTQGEQLQVLEDLGFNDARITRTLLGLANNTELVGDQMRIANDAFRENTALTKEAGERFKTFDSQLQITKNVLTDIGITIGSKLLPKITPLLQRFNEFINQNQGGIEKFGTDLAGAFERFADAVGKTDWTPFIDGLKTSASLAKGAFDAFNALPDDFKKLVLVGFGINKFTGGLITSIGKDLASAFGQQFLSRGSSPGNPLWVQSVGGIGGPGGAGGGGGVLGTLSKAVLPVAIVSAAAGVAFAVTNFPANTAGGKVFRGASDVNDPSKRLEHLLSAQVELQRRANGGDQFAQRQLEQVNAEIALLRGEAARKADATTQAAVRIADRMDALKAEQAAGAAKIVAQMPPIRSEMIGVRQAQAAAMAAETFNSQSERTAIANASAAQRAAAERIRAATEQARADNTAAQARTTEAARSAAAAIRDKDLSVSVTVPISIRNIVDARDRISTIYRKNS